MKSRQSDTNPVRKIVLPSGRSIEVIRFDDQAETQDRPLHVCPDCASTMVQPHDWSEVEAQGWQLTLECPNCGWVETGVFTDAQVEELEEHLDAGVSTMIADLQRLVHANMTADIESFVGALAADLILPEDF